MPRRNLWSNLLRDYRNRGSIRRPRLERLDDRDLPSTTFIQTNLASDLPGVARVQDLNLVDPVGIAVDTVNPLAGSFGFGIPSLGSQLGQVFALGGGTLARPSTLDLGAGEPIGVAFNGTGSTTDFLLTGPLSTRPAAFLFGNSLGQIVAWNPRIGEQDEQGNILTFSLTGHVVFSATDGAFYTGVTLGHVGGANFLYAADLFNGKIDVLDGQFHKVAPGTNGFESFTDPNRPAGYQPLNIQAINGKLFVTFNHSSGPLDPVAGNGFVDVFETNGHFDGRLISGGDLNDPYGLALAPAGFGDFAGALLVGNIIDGHIHGYNPTTGAELGTLTGPNGQPLAIDGLHGLTFGAGAGKVGDADTLYFTAGPAGGQHGLFGNIDVNPGTAPKVASVTVNDGSAQRSMVTRIQVAFDQHVTLPAAAAAAFQLVRQGDNANVALTADVDDLGRGTVVTLTFVGGAVDPSLLNNPSLADGRYTLTVLAAGIGSVNGPLDGDGNGAAGDNFVLAGSPANKLFRLFGDADGNGVVDLTDLQQFRGAFNASFPSPAYLAFLDVDANGVVDLVDLQAFRGRFNVTV